MGGLAVLLCVIGGLNLMTIGAAGTYDRGGEGERWLPLIPVGFGFILVGLMVGAYRAVTGG